MTTDLVMFLCIICIIIFQAIVNISLALQVRKWINAYNFVLKRLIDTEDVLNESKKIDVIY